MSDLMARSGYGYPLTGHEPAGGILVRTAQRSIRSWKDRDQKANLKPVFAYNPAENFLWNHALKELGSHQSSTDSSSERKKD